jgi:hypothetical protein
MRSKPLLPPRLRPRAALVEVEVGRRKLDSWTAPPPIAGVFVFLFFLFFIAGHYLGVLLVFNGGTACFIDPCSGGPAELASGGLAGRVYGPSNTLKFRGPACGAHPRTLRFHAPCLPCGSDSTTRENPGGDAGGVRSSGTPGATMQRGRAAPRQLRANEQID